MANIAKHITKYSYEDGHSFNGFRVAVFKKGINFQKYISSKHIGWDAALKEAKRIEAELIGELACCQTREDILAVFDAYSEI